MPFDMLLDALCDRCWAKEELYGGPLEEFEGLEGSHRFLAREGWRITRHWTLCPRCKELPPMTSPSAPHTTAASLSLRVHDLEQLSAAAPDLEVKLNNMLRERESMVEQLGNWDRSIESTRQRIKDSHEAGRVLSVLTGQFTQLVDRETPRVIKSGNQKRVTRDQLRAYIRDHPWSRPVEIEEALGYGRNTASSSLAALVQLGELQNAHGHYALVGVPMHDLQPAPASQRSRICAYVAAHPGQRMSEILRALDLTQGSSSNFSALVNNGRLVWKNKRYYPPKKDKATPAPAPAKVQPAPPPAEVPAAPAPTPEVLVPTPAPDNLPEQEVPTSADVRGRVLSYLRSNQEQMFRIRMLADALEIPEETVRTVVRDLVKEKLVEMQPGGWYGSVDEDPDGEPAETEAQEEPGSAADVAGDPEFVEAPAQVFVTPPALKPEDAPAQVEAVPVPEPEVQFPETAPLVPAAPAISPVPAAALEPAPEVDKEEVRRLLPPRLTQDQRQACELLATSPQGMTPRLLAARLNWMQSRIDKVVHSLLKEDVLLKVGAEVRLAPRYRGGVPRG